MKRVDICPERTRFKRVVHLEGRREAQDSPPPSTTTVVHRDMNSPAGGGKPAYTIPNKFPRGGNKQNPVRQTGAGSRESNIPPTTSHPPHLSIHPPNTHHDRLKITTSQQQPPHHHTPLHQSKSTPHPPSFRERRRPDPGHRQGRRPRGRQRGRHRRWRWARRAWWRTGPGG